MSEPRDSREPPRITQPNPPAAPGSWAVRLAWFFGLWLAGVAGVSAVAYGLRLWLL